MGISRTESVGEQIEWLAGAVTLIFDGARLKWPVISRVMVDERCLVIAMPVRPWFVSLVTSPS